MIRGEARWGPWPARLVFTALICVVESTHLLAQPSLFEYWSWQEVALGWLDYLVECLCYGTCMLIGASLAERLMPRFGQVAGFVLLFALVGVGAFTGGAVANVYYGVSADYLVNPRFIADTVNWYAIGAVIVMIYALQRRATRASMGMHRTRVHQVELQKQTLEAQLQVMRAQIEPHFLFNTLANAKRLCQINAAQGLVMLDNLILYLRAALPLMRASGSVTLGAEADLVMAYAAVLTIRMRPRLHVASVIPDELRACQFPPMMLLTLMENAIKHGINPSPDGGTIEVAAAMDGGDLLVTVADTGVGFGVAPTGGTGIGLANTRARLDALYGTRAELLLEANHPRGVIVSIRIPALMPAGAAVTAAA